MKAHDTESKEYSDDSRHAGASSLLTMFEELTVRLEQHWRLYTGYPVMMTPNAPAKKGFSIVRWHRRFHPLNLLRTYTPISPMLEYLSQYGKDELTALLQLSEINLRTHNLWTFRNPLVQLTGLLAGIYTLITTMIKLAGDNELATLFGIIQPILKGAFVGVIGGAVFFAILVVLSLPNIARARVLRDLIDIALQQKLSEDERRKDET